MIPKNASDTERLCCKNEKRFEVSLINILRAPMEPLKKVSVPWGTYKIGPISFQVPLVGYLSYLYLIFTKSYSILVSSLLPLSQAQGSTGSFVFKMPWDSHISLHCPLYTHTPKLLRNCQFSVKTNSVSRQLLRTTRWHF